MFETVFIAAFVFVLIGICLSLFIVGTKRKLIPNVPVKITINDEIEATTASGVTLLNALSSNEYTIPSPCGGKATCHQCKVKITEGSGEILETDRSTFSPTELKEGWRLSCQCKVRQPMKINLPASSMEANTFDGVVISNDNVATFIKELCVKIPDHIDLKYIPGDYLQVHIPDYDTNTESWKETIDSSYHGDWEGFGMFNRQITYRQGREEVIRAYSMASYPEEGKVVKFNIRIASPPFANGKMKKVPWGIGSAYLFALKKGDKVHLSGPFGESHMIDDQRAVYFLIGGAGSSFGRSHIFDLVQTKNTNRKVVLWYGARSLRENIYEDEFTQLAKTHENFEYHIVLSDPLEQDFANGWPKDDATKTNFLYKAFEEAELKNMETPEDHLYYCCGPPKHNEMVLKILDDYGVPKENVVLDDFGS